MAQPGPFDQHRYQVRLEWGVGGLRRLAPADIVVVVDVLRFSTSVTDAVAEGGAVELAKMRDVSINGAPLAEAAAGSGALVLAGCLRNASAVAAEVLAEQSRRGLRTSIAIVAAGELATGELAAGEPDAAPRFAVEDLLGAGAIVDALTALGVDHTSPEAAAAGQAFQGLRGALRHLLTASGSGQELIERGLRDDVLNAAQLDAASVVPVLRGAVFTR